jgi:hypothetical protein
MGEAICYITSFRGMMLAGADGENRRSQAPASAPGPARAAAFPAGC